MNAAKTYIGLRGYILFKYIYYLNMRKLKFFHKTSQFFSVSLRSLIFSNFQLAVSFVFNRISCYKVCLRNGRSLIVAQQLVAFFLGLYTSRFLEVLVFFVAAQFIVDNTKLKGCKVYHTLTVDQFFI